MKLLKNKVILITGGRLRPGTGYCLPPAEEGARLSLVDVSKKGLEETKQHIAASYPGVEVINIDGGQSYKY